jgi:hypothetical protein
VGLWKPFLLSCLLLLPAAAAAVRREQVRQRQKAGLCTQCGYDLKGNRSGVCPECGDEPSPAGNPSQA